MKAERWLITTQSYRHEYGASSEIPTQYGYLVETDCEGYQRLLRIPTPTDSPFGERVKTGLRGICEWRGKLYVASWNRIHVVDYESFRVVDSFDHPLMADIHGLNVDEKGIVVASSLIDSLLVFDGSRSLSGVLVFPESRLYKRKERVRIDLQMDYRLRGKKTCGCHSFHVNHVAPYGERHLLITGRGKKKANGRILLVDRETLHFKVWIGGLFGPHDGLNVNDRTFAVTETNKSGIALIRKSGLLGPRVTERFELPACEARYWTRGLAVAGDGTFLVGRSAWKGDDRQALVARLLPGGDVVDQYPLSFNDYPECRIFQILRSPVEN